MTRNMVPKISGPHPQPQMWPKNDLVMPTQAPMGLPSAKQALHWASQARGQWIGCFGVSLVESKIPGLSHFGQICPKWHCTMLSGPQIAKAPTH